jgi:acetylornithine deacetylase/succinyl-diaminopimelate desuccinylase-like protein
MIHRLKKHVDFLCSLQPSRSVANQDSLLAAGHYIRDRLIDSGYADTRTQSYMPGPEGECFNVIAGYGDPKAGTIIIGDHYDTVNDTPGADDNASAVAAMLELARMLKENQPELIRCLK